MTVQALLLHEHRLVGVGDGSLHSTPEGNAIRIAYTGKEIIVVDQVLVASGAVPDFPSTLTWDIAGDGGKVLRQGDELVLVDWKL